MRVPLPFTLALPAEPGEPFTDWLLKAVHHDRRRRDRVLTLIIQWDHLADDLGREPSVEEYGERWSVPTQTAYRTLTEFREAFPEERTPDGVVSELWNGLGEPYLRGSQLGSMTAVRVKGDPPAARTDPDDPGDPPALVVLKRVYRQFCSIGSWPTVAEVQRDLDRDALGIDLDLERDILVPDLAFVGREPIAVFRLTLAGIRATGEGHDDLKAFVAAVGLAYGRYRSDTPQPRLYREDLTDAGLAGDRADRVRALLDAEPLATGGGADEDGTWYRDISPSVRYLGSVSSIEAYLEAVAQRARVARAQPTLAIGTVSGSVGGIRDAELRRRCADLLSAATDHDRAIREACVILEDRVRIRAGLGDAVFGVPLMELAFSQHAPLIRLGRNDPEQRGAMDLFRGMMAYLRNPANHGLNRADPIDASQIVGWVDFLLGQLAAADNGSLPIEPAGAT